MAQLLQSFADWCFYRKEFEPDYYVRLREMGFDAVEMTPPERRAQARAAGLKLLNTSSPGMQKGLNRLENHGELVPQISEVIRTAGKENISEVIVFSGNRDGQEDRVGIANCVTGLKQLAKVAESAGVTLLFELLNKYDHKDYQCDSVEFAATVVSQAGSPRVRILYDIYHAHRMGEDVAKSMLTYLPLIGHLHVAGDPGRGFPGPGQTIDYPALVRTVTKAGYTGYWGQEFMPKGDVMQEVREAHDIFAAALK